MRIAAVTSMALACACGGPSPVPALALVSGSYTIATTLDDNWCVATGHAPATALSLRAVPEQRDVEWVFRLPDQPESTFELWVHRTSREGPIVLNGIIRGKATISTTPPVTADFGKLGVIAGITDLRQANGTINGQVVFADAEGNALTCTKAGWSFVRVD
jgi:hypothetical protein